MHISDLNVLLLTSLQHQEYAYACCQTERALIMANNDTCVMYALFQVCYGTEVFYILC